MATPTTDDLASPSPGGLLLVDKPAGVTSHDVVAMVRRALRTRRAGHTGTLDPFATGLLVILVGRGTRLIPYVEGEPKVYDATIRFGAETDTDDVTGRVMREADLPSDVAIAEGVARLTGALEQIPPAYSAKQVGGTRAYAAARRGAALELPAARVAVHSWRLIERAGPDLKVRITCGGGTYIRALARDLGRFTDSAAHLSSLRRVCSGPFSVDAATAIDRVEPGVLHPLGDAVPSMTRQPLDDRELSRVLHGNGITARVAGDEGSLVALVHGPRELIAVAARAGDELRPKVVLK